MKRWIESVTRKAWALPLLTMATLGVTAELNGQHVHEISTEYQSLTVERVAGDLEQPWAIGFLPEGDLLVSERPGRLQLVSGSSVTEVSGLPPIHAQGQGGMMDVVVHPDYQETGWIYLTYSKGDEEETVPALIRARLDGSQLVDVEELFESNTPTSPGRHYGSRVVFMGDGTLLMSIGDRGAQPDRAQDTRDHSGTVVRLNEDGTVPSDNPLVGNDAYAPEIYSYGHRNIQGMILHPTTGEVWATEHGPRGGDELNLILPGQDYGWPDVGKGREYGTQEPYGEDRTAPQVMDPVFEFLPTLAPSGLAVVGNGTFDETWEGNLLAGGLRSERILRLVIEDQVVVHAEEIINGELGRIRDVRLGPDGAIYVATGEDDGAIYRITPDS